MEEYKVLSQNEVNDLYEMFNHLITLLNKNAIPWVATDGTLLGAIRNGGLIPWDDDIDIAIDKKHLPTLLWLKYQIEKGGLYEFVKVGKYMKLKKDNVWIDIFLLDDWRFPQKHFKNLSFIVDEIYPIRQCMFGDIEINIPNKAEEYLDRILPDWNTTAVIYNHTMENKISLPLTYELRQPYLATYP